jgi:hypothetical protein
MIRLFAELFGHYRNGLTPLERSDRFAFDQMSTIGGNGRRRWTHRKAALEPQAMRPPRTGAVGRLGRPHLAALPPHPGNASRRIPPLPDQAFEPPAQRLGRGRVGRLRRH